MLFQRLYPFAAFRVKNAGDAKVAYLTFDDGTIPEVTPRVLEILARYGVKATFFVVGENIEKYPEVFKQVVQAGHAIGNHTYNHIKGWQYSTDEYLANVVKCEALLSPSASRLSPLFRPPYGKATWLQRRALTRMGYRIYMWDVLTHDYNASYTSERMLQIIRRYTRNGSVINFHDSLKSNERMLATLPKAIEWLQAEGYELRTL